ILRAAREFAATGAPSPGVEEPDLFRTARCGFFAEQHGIDWEQAYDRQVDSAVRAPDFARAAE
ncbi:MAG: Rieske 2Fe-2S domain-containing protein, partial [Alphaproteobacteria bacterium]